MQALTDKTFHKIIKDSSIPVLVDFWADWCGPCRTIAPFIERIAKEYDGRLLVAKVNMDAAEQIGRQFGIRSIPTLLVFKDGAVVGQLVGAVPFTKIEEEVKKHLD
jgi:thioredoxin 1